MHVHSAKPRACFSMLSSRGVWGHAPTEDFLRIYPSKVKSGVNLDQNCSTSYASDNNKAKRLKYDVIDQLPPGQDTYGVRVVIQTTL